MNMSTSNRISSRATSTRMLLNGALKLFPGGEGWVINSNLEIVNRIFRAIEWASTVK